MSATCCFAHAPDWRSTLDAPHARCRHFVFIDGVHRAHGALMMEMIPMSDITMLTLPSTTSPNIAEVRREARKMRNARMKRE